MNIEIFFSQSFLYALCIGMFIGSIAAYLGSLMVTKHMTLMAGALGHLALPGMALALKYNFDISFGALLFLTIGTALIWLLEKKTHLPIEALTAIIFTTSTAITFLYLPKQETMAALLGDISNVTFLVFIISIGVSCIILAIIHIIYKKMIFISISTDLAQTNNIPINIFNFIYLICIALMIALGVRIIGGLMTAALVAIPASTSRNLSRNLEQYAIISFLAGGISCIVGIFVSQIIAIPVGSAIIITSSLFFFISLFFRKK